MKKKDPIMSANFTIEPPSKQEYHEYYERYIGKVDHKKFWESFEGQPSTLNDLLGAQPDEEVAKLHEPYTWTLKQVMGHLIDCERIFSCRMLRIAVGDQTPIPGIDQNIYVANLDYQTPEMADLLEEFELLRKANVLLVRRLSLEALGRMGTASDNPTSAKANLYILVGHVNYHLEIMKKRLH
jgi:hypothetical protein